MELLVSPRLEPLEKTCFVTAQGAHYRYGINRQDMDINTIYALKQYLDDHDPVSVNLRGTIVLI